MKTIKRNEWRVTRDEMHAAGGERSRHPSPVTIYLPAFTLIELLTVIAVIGIIAALILPVSSSVHRQTIIHSAQAQMAQLATAIERYKSAYGFYPPASAFGPLTNQLYYELEGTTLTNANYVTLDHIASIPAASLATVFGAGVGGFMNCDKPGADEAAARAQNFLTELNTNQFSAVTINGTSINLLVSPVGGPDTTYTPLGMSDVNPWRYVNSGTHNPGSYDLWIQLVIAGKTNLVCNWTKSVQINNGSVR
jgi:prepilin-type N-terminal cleavage/methylation domain-containing protein